MKLEDIGEFGLIRRFAKPLKLNLPDGVEGIGNDCAVVPYRNDLSFLVTTDLLVENTHFIKDLISPEDLGYKSLAVNLSDIAAMGGKPRYAFLSIAMPIDTPVNWVDSFFEGLQELADQEGVLLLGGDTTRSNQFFVNFLVIGEVETRFIKRRSQALPGDIICCTGNLGNSGGGLKIALENLPEQPFTSFLLHSHYRPRPHIKEGQWLSKQPGVHAMMDLSDGLASDIQRIMEESNCGAHIEIERLPISPELRDASKFFGWKAEEIALTGGEDYSLLLTVDPKEYSAISDDYFQNFQRPLFPIGAIFPNNSLSYSHFKKPYSPEGTGYNHFKS
jgi:thiamine-monophosphate kinase